MRAQRGPVSGEFPPLSNNLNERAGKVVLCLGRSGLSAPGLGGLFGTDLHPDTARGCVASGGPGPGASAWTLEFRARIHIPAGRKLEKAQERKVDNSAHVSCCFVACLMGLHVYPQLADCLCTLHRVLAIETVLGEAPGLRQGSCC